jgi:hypothetical protein
LISRAQLASNGLTSGVDSLGQARAGFGPTAAEKRAASQ